LPLRLTKSASGYGREKETLLLPLPERKGDSGVLSSLGRVLEWGLGTNKLDLV
jgi:hypothetical protein